MCIHCFAAFVKALSKLTAAPVGRQIRVIRGGTRVWGRSGQPDDVTTASPGHTNRVALGAWSPSDRGGNARPAQCRRTVGGLPRRSAIVRGACGEQRLDCADDRASPGRHCSCRRPVGPAGPRVSASSPCPCPCPRVPIPRCRPRLRPRHPCPQRRLRARQVRRPPRTPGGRRLPLMPSAVPARSPSLLPLRAGLPGCVPRRPCCRSVAPPRRRTRHGDHSVVRDGRRPQLPPLRAAGPRVWRRRRMDCLGITGSPTSRPSLHVGLNPPCPVGRTEGSDVHALRASSQ